MVIWVASVTIAVHLWVSQQPTQAQVTSSQEELSVALPAPRVHPLPPSLTQWQSAPTTGDYFSAIQSTRVGYLIWSRFPVQIYIEPATPDNSDRSQQWVEAIAAAVEEWGAYLPLQQVNIPESADILIWRRSPPLQVNGSTFRARSAETRYTVYVDQTASGDLILAHRFTILLRPDQTPDYLRAAARHELGHALGIWGHSPVATDALYASQVRNPPAISARDINTLKRIYEQPTRLGWPLPTGTGN
jgi:predicted Zn-dependent protease